MSSTHSIRYRPDVDGLRAVAVLPVLLFHFDVPPFSGGYVGVDIFFVISGYLIGKIILDELEAGRYSIAQFYVRRIRRIFPALFVVLAVSSVCAWIFLFPSELKDYGKSLIAVTFFVSNLFFHLSGGYFAAAAETQPLLHTWSLAVEEQFYIFFPLILMLLQKLRPGRPVLPIVVLGALSFLCACWLLRTDRDAAFYLVQSRAWELLAGALLAARAFKAPTPRWANLLGIMGICMILAAVFLFDSRTLFPGPAALLPVLGAALLIHAGACERGSLMTCVLATRPLVFIGLISYSLYLWHWPLVVFYRFYDIQIDAVEVLGLFGACFALAILSWRYVEQPFRRGGLHLPRAQIFAHATAAMAIFVIVGGSLLWADGATWRFPTPVAEVAAYSAYDSGEATRKGRCFLTSDHPDFSYFDQQACLATEVTQKNYLLVGDSHGAHLWPGLKAVYRDRNILQATSSGCKPVLHAQGEPRCKKLMEYIYSEFVPKRRLDAVLISARWRAEDLPALLSTIAYVKRYADRVYVMGPIAEYEDRLPLLLARDMLAEHPRQVALGRRGEQVELDRIFAAKVRDAGAGYVSTYEALCVPNGCLTRDEAGMPMQFDYGHLTEQGAVLLARRLRERNLFP